MKIQKPLIGIIFKVKIYFDIQVILWLEYRFFPCKNWQSYNYSYSKETGSWKVSWGTSIITIFKGIFEQPRTEFPYRVSDYYNFFSMWKYFHIWTQI